LGAYLHQLSYDDHFRKWLQDSTLLAQGQASAVVATDEILYNMAVFDDAHARNSTVLVHASRQNAACVILMSAQYHHMTAFSLWHPSSGVNMNLPQWKDG